ncbi:MAG TPA: SMC-Scp complex subunit ScpB [Pirellulales bacterium]|nr:SMC-Scp complex subunit ScpB [Pirellulales bacterium]
MHKRLPKLGYCRGASRLNRKRGSALPAAFASKRRSGFARWQLFIRGGSKRRPEPIVQGPLARDDRLARVEAALFLAREPLTSRKIGQLAGLSDGTAARTAVRQLNRLYDDGGSPFRAEELAGGFQLLTRPMFGPWLRRLLHTPVETRLTAPALETLAVVAYRQPVLRSEVEAIRGVQCGDILRQLMDRDLVRITSRADDLGRPLLYGTTRRFLQIFGLRHLDELPQAETLRRRPAPAEPAAASQPSAEASANSSQPAATSLQTAENRAI